MSAGEGALAHEDAASSSLAGADAVLSVPIADEVFFVLLDDGSGLMTVHPRLVGPTLGASLLAELAFGGWIEVDEDEVVPTAGRRWGSRVPQDAMLHTVWDTVLGQEPRLSVRDWIAFLAGSAVDDVAGRLSRANQIVIGEKRRGLGRTRTFKPADRVRAAWFRGELAQHCHDPRRLTDAACVRAGLCDAAGLMHEILATAPHGSYKASMAQVNARLAGHPAVVAVLDGLRQSVNAKASSLA